MAVDYIGISDKARRIKAYFRSAGNTMTPEKVCHLKFIDIELIEMDTPLSTKVYKANYSYLKRQHIVQYNRRIHRYLDAVLYHEIGHRVLHWRCAGFVFHVDSDVFGVSTIFECEANVFAAEMLMSDDDVLKLFETQCSFFQAAQVLNVPDEMLYFKCRILEARGYKMDIPICAAGAFMKGKEY